MAELSCGIVGLPNVGKSTLFNALTSIAAEAANYPFCTIDPNVGNVEVPDPRLQALSSLSNSKKLVYATIQFVDIAGLVAGAHKGEGLGNKFLSNIREADAIVHVVRCFEDPNIIHVAGHVDPINDIEVVNLELSLSDFQTCENIIGRLEKQAKGNKDFVETITCLKKIRDHLDQNKPVRSLDLTKEEIELIKLYPFLTNKKILYVANVSEDDLPEMDNQYVRSVIEYAKKEGGVVIPVCAKIEEEIAQLPIGERGEFLKDMGLEQSGLQKIIKTSFQMLDLITYLTTGEIETRAWTIHKGTLAPEAAGKIHTDLEKGFIRAEVVAFDDMIKYGGRVAAREAGKARAEGKEYEVKDGDVMLIFHN